MLLTSAKTAYNEKNYPFAAGRFREYLGKFASNKDAPVARYGLALALIDGPDKDYNAAIEQLNVGQRQGRSGSSVRGLLLGLSYRGLGVKALAQAAAKPAEAHAASRPSPGRFEEAAKQFAAAVAAFTAQRKRPIPTPRSCPSSWNGPPGPAATRPRCSCACCRAKEAQATPGAVHRGQDCWPSSRYRGLGLYYHGFASFLLKDDLAAGRSLSQSGRPSPIRFMARMPATCWPASITTTANAQEAIDQYEGVLADYCQEQDRPAAEDAQAARPLQERSRREGPPGAAGARTRCPITSPGPTFFLGVMQYEDGKFAEALTRFDEPSQQADARLRRWLSEAQLRQGFCQVQLKQFADAQKTLQPLVDKEPRLADQALLWIGKAQVGAADPAKPQAHDQALKTAIDTFRKAADRANQLVQH